MKTLLYRQIFVTIKLRESYFQTYPCSFLPVSFVFPLQQLSLKVRHSVNLNNVVFFEPKMLFNIPSAFAWTWQIFLIRNLKLCESSLVFPQYALFEHRCRHLPCLLMVIMSRGWYYVSELRPPACLLLIPRWYMSMESHGGVISTVEKFLLVHRNSLAMRQLVI
jgi:hypothetical protein